MEFRPNEPVKTEAAKVVVDAGLRVGEHRFQLVVVNSRGQKSRPAEIVIQIVERQ